MYPGGFSGSAAAVVYVFIDMLMVVGYHDFSEIEDMMREISPPIVYKCRYWKDDFHKRLLTNQEIWFSHPADLNDLYDCRPPYKVIYEGIEQGGYEKLTKIIRETNRSWSSSRVKSEVDILWQRIIENPEAYFEENYRNFTHTRSKYDKFGVFSASVNGLSEAIWEKYGDRHRGFCIGLKTVDLAKYLHTQNIACACNMVEYHNEPIEYHLMKEQGGNLFIEDLFRKSVDWSPEEEYRFLTIQIPTVLQRGIKIPKDIIAELLLGSEIDLESETQIRKVVYNSYGSSLPIFKLCWDNGGMMRVAISL